MLACVCKTPKEEEEESSSKCPPVCLVNVCICVAPSVAYANEQTLSTPLHSASQRIMTGDSGCDGGAIAIVFVASKLVA